MLINNVQMQHPYDTIHTYTCAYETPRVSMWIGEGSSVGTGTSSKHTCVDASHRGSIRRKQILMYMYISIGGIICGYTGTSSKHTCADASHRGSIRSKQILMYMVLADQFKIGP